MTAGSCGDGHPPPTRPCKAVSMLCGSAGIWPPTTWSARCRRASQRTPGGSAWSCSTARWRRSKTIFARSMRPHRFLRFCFPRHRSRTSRSGWKSRSASPSRSDRNDFAGKKRSTRTSAAGPLCAGRSCSAPEIAAALVPRQIPDERRGELERHLSESASVFALDLRDRALDGESLPERPTLADLARPCPVCGDWLDWRGHCDTCATRAYRRQTLRAEAGRLVQERMMKRKTATSGQNDSRSRASASPTSTPTSPASKPADRTLHTKRFSRLEVRGQHGDAGGGQAIFAQQPPCHLPVRW